MGLQEIKNAYAIEQGYEDWSKMRKSTASLAQFDEDWTNICIRAQKAALEKASENTSIQYVRPITLNYQEIKDLITNPENLIR